MTANTGFENAVAPKFYLARNNEPEDPDAKTRGGGLLWYNGLYLWWGKPGWNENHGTWCIKEMAFCIEGGGAKTIWNVPECLAQFLPTVERGECIEVNLTVAEEKEDGGN